MAGDLCTLFDYLIDCGKYNNEDTLYSKYHYNLVNTFVINHQHVYADIDIELEESVTSKYHSSIVNQLLKLEYYKSDTDNASRNSILNNSFWMFIHQTLETKDFITLFKTHLIVEFLEQDQYFVRIYGPPITLKSFTNKRKTQSRAYRKISIQSWLANTPLKSYHNYKLLINFKDLEPFLDESMCKTLKRNHDRMAYLAVVNTMCIPKAILDHEVPNTLNCIIDKKTIMKYLKVITNKLFKDVFDLNGSKVLKPFVFKHLNTILNHGYNQFTTLSELKSELLEYLNKRKYTNDKHSLIHIVNWLFIHYYSCLIKYSFFGLTFTSSDAIVFYKHLDADYFISVKADLFINSHFVPYNGCRKATKTSENKTVIHDLSNDYYHCNLKPVLKNLKMINNFRFLSVPDKLRTFNSYSKHIAFNMQYVKPTNKLLAHLRKEVLPELYQKRHPTFKKDILVQNISEIMVHFNTFITERKYRTVNKQKDLFYLKFDIKNSFDSVPLELLNTILSNIFKEVGLERQFTLTKEDSILFSQTVSTSNKRSLEFKPITKLLIDKDVNTNPAKKLKSGNSNKDISLSNHIKIVQDVSKPKSLTIQEVKDITHKEMFKTITTNGKTCYERKRGLGQGMYLPPILSNIFYDDMVHTSTDLLPHKNDNKFFIRFMDDFLLISENYMVLQKIKMKLLKNELFDKRFEVFVNTSKLELSKKCNQTFEFAGLEFDLAERSVRKKVETSMNIIKYSHVKSFKEIYNKLLVVLEIRLNGDCTMRLKSNSVEVIQRQVLHICENIFTMFTRYLKTVDKKKINMTEAKHFHKFFFNVLNLFAAHMNGMNSFDHFNEKSFYRLKHLTESLDNIIALQFICNLKEVNSNKSTKFIEVLQKFLHI